MDYFIIFITLLLITILSVYYKLRPFRHGGTRLPPGPYPFLVIGNILSIGSKPHHSLASLSKIHGPLMSLKVGILTTIVVSSPEIAQKILAKNDRVCSGRQALDATRAIDHNKYSVVFISTTNHWRTLRKNCKEHIFSQAMMDAKQGKRLQKVEELLVFVRRSSVVNIRDATFTTTLNFLSDIFFSMDLAHYDSNLSQEFRDHVVMILKALGSPNLSDFFPVLRFLDLQGISRRARFHLSSLFNIFETIIRNRIESGETKNDLLDVLLNLSKENSININDITHLILDLFIAGTDTTTVTVEWAMTELLRHPDKMQKAQAELRAFAGDKPTIKEWDISKLPYIQSVIKETFRLYPPGPMLVPHKAEAEFEVDVEDKYVYWVPKNTLILVNAWAIGHDPNVWEDSEVFMPERFLKSEIEFKGRDFRLIPFGSGRRICPGMILGEKMVYLLLTSLLFSFDWELEKGIKPQDIDMNETCGLALQKIVPLTAIAIPIRP